MTARFEPPVVQVVIVILLSILFSISILFEIKGSSISLFLLHNHCNLINFNHISGSKDKGEGFRNIQNTGR